MDQIESNSTKPDSAPVEEDNNAKEDEEAQDSSEDQCTPTKLISNSESSNESEQQEDSKEPEQRNEHEDPIPSGTGSVNKDCSVSDLIGWSEILPRWHQKLNQRPRGLENLVRIGIPEPLRGEVWQLLSGAHQHQHLMDKYRILLTKQAASEQIILCDVHRTYPAHKNFRSDSNESDSLIEPLYKVCKAYAIYDEEVGYCQGLSFLVAALLLHMPEEQAFCVFVRIMEDYGLRNLFRRKFDELYLKFYQLEQLIQDQIPDLHKHFAKLGLKPYTYASQWFLTVFTAKFPLNAVFHIMDIFLLHGMDTVFQIAIALLKLSKEELLAADFEGVFRLFRVGMPKRYMEQENLLELISVAANVNLKKLNRYAKTYEILKQKEKMIANAMVTKTQQDIVSNLEDEKTRLEVELSQMKEVCRRELQRAEAELLRDSNIISGYKQICTQQSKRLDAKTDCLRQFVDDIDTLLIDNESLHKDFRAKVDELMFRLDQSEEEEVLVSQSSSSKQTSGDIIDDNVKRNIARKESNTGDLNSDVGSIDSGQKSRKPIGAFIKSSSGDTDSECLMEHINQLELELARTKLALVEAECKCQQLSHDLTSIKTSIKASTPTTNRLSFSKLNNILGEKLAMISGPYSDTGTNQVLDSEPTSPTHLAKILQVRADNKSNLYSNNNYKENNNINYKQSDHDLPQC